MSINNGVADIDYSISKPIRGNGYGKEIIRLVKERAAEGHPKLTKLSGRVKPQNVVSFYFFIDNGFEEKLAGTKNTCCLNMI